MTDRELHPHARQERMNDLVLSFISVRQCLGYLGLFLPVSLLVYAAFAGPQPSISDYYYTAMGDVLVGTLSSISIFLISYTGYSRLAGETLSDAWLARIAGISALGTALLPIRREGYPICDGPDGHCWIFGITWSPNWLHYTMAIIFFLCMALFSLVQFPKGERGADGAIRWTLRTRIYLGCGTAILAAMAAAVPYFLAGEEARAAMQSRQYLFWCESVGITAFAIAWLTKGRALLTLRYRLRGSRAR